MRPKKLTMQAFESYRKKAVIDFDNFKDSGVFLITGDTGAGKTTIFDAMVYALFDMLNGGRTSEMIRNENASIDENTIVEFEFEFKGKIYRVNRTKRCVKSRKSTVEYTLKDECELSYKNKNDQEITITKKTDVDNKIKELLGLNGEQFTQIVMLPQGEFVKFLVADTKDKTEILNKIINTEKFRKFQKMVNDYVLSKKNNVKNKKAEALNSVKDLYCTSDISVFSEFQTAVENISENYYAIPKVIEVTDRVIEEGRKLQKDTEKNINIIENEIEDITKKIEKGKNNESLKEKLKNAKSKLEAEKRNSENIRQQKEIAETEYKKIPKLQVEISNIKETLQYYDELEKLKQYKFNLETEKDKNKMQLENEQSNLDKKNKDIEDTNLKLKNFGDLNSQLFSLNNQSTELNRKLNDLKDKLINAANYKSRAENSLDIISKAKSFINAYYIEKESLKKAEIDFNNKNIAYQHASENYTKINSIYLSEQAGILAKNLAEGKPCPVCGSLNHPNLAVLMHGDISKEKVEEAKSKEEIANESANKASVKVGKIKSNYENYIKYICDSYFRMYKEKCDDVEKCINAIYNSEKKILQIKENTEKSIQNINQEIENTKKKIENRVQEINKIYENIEEKKRLEESIVKYNSELRSFEQLINDYKNSQISLTKDIEHIDNKIKELSEKLKYPNKQVAQNEISGRQSVIENINNKYNNANTNYENSKNDITGIKSEIKTTEEQIDKTLQFDVKEMESQKGELLRKKNSLQNLEKKLMLLVNSNKKTNDNLKKIDKEINEINTELDSIEMFSDVINGNLKGNVRINLETFVLQRYFDIILINANRRFLKMTDGHYELLRKKEFDEKRGQKGLDIDVFDHYDNKERDVKSLSGGEKFLAALSLALGMSEQIQNISGGVEINSMFIDEGFGSLDSEKLNLAVNTLNQMSRNSLIGVISHIEELGNMIDNKIIVKKDKVNGSSIEIKV